MNPKNLPIIVLSGSSGSGKTTLCRLSAERLGLHHLVSHTTRPPRPGEVNGKDYSFVTRDEFQAMIGHGDFVEWAEVYGNLYGTSRKVIQQCLDRGEGVILDLDPQGALAMKRLYPECLAVFIKVPSDELAKRLDQRGTDSEAVRQKRLEQVKNEESFQKYYDHVLENSDLELTFQALKDLIEEA